MAYGAKVIADSVAMDADGKPVRLTTVEATFPRMILAEVNTHRALSRNSASSRAIPVLKNIERVRNDMFVPEVFGKNQRGMQAGASLDDDATVAARAIWMATGTNALAAAEQLAKLDVHKQIANRLIEPFGWHMAILSATCWANFFALRTGIKAQPEFKIVATMIEEAMAASEPRICRPGDVHAPYIQPFEEHLTVMEKSQLSSARCARVSYLTHDGQRDIAADYDLHDRLLADRHMSPFEHTATVALGREDYGNFRAPWLQYRKTIPGEAVAPREGS